MDAVDGILDILLKMNSLFEDTGFIDDFSEVLEKGLDACGLALMRDDELDGRGKNVGIGGGKTTDGCWG